MGTFRFCVEFVRQPDAQLGLFENFISMGQILSTPMILIGALIMIWSYKTQKPTTQATSKPTKAMKGK